MNQVGQGSDEVAAGFWVTACTSRARTGLNGCSAGEEETKLRRGIRMGSCRTGCPVR